MRRLATLVLAVAVGGSIPGPAAATATATAGCGRQDVVVSQETLHIQVDPPASPVRPGQVARFEVSVTRPAGPDALGGDPPGGAPAPRVLAAVWVGLEPYSAASVERTDEGGTALVEVEIRAGTRPGAYDVRGFSWNVLLSGCLTLEEIGETDLPGALTVLRPRGRH